MKKLSSLSLFSPKIIIDRLRISRKWALMLIPLASLGTIPLILAWGGYGENSSQMANSPHGDQAIAAMSGEELIKTLPPLSQIPAPPTQADSGLKSPRPITAKDLQVEKTKETEKAAAEKPANNGQSQLQVKNSPVPNHQSPASAQAPMPQAPMAATVDYTPPPLEIRVGIQRNVPSVAIAVSSQGYLQDRNGKGLMTLSAGQGLTVTAEGESLIVDGRSFPGVAWFTPAPSGYLAVGDRWYRGRVLLVPQGNQVLAVNYVDLENYLTSVVGSEMHSTAPAEALKAQAIAARSYALVHMVRPASQWFDLGDNQRWQVYKGIASEQNTSRNAVISTLGQVLSYNGGVVESLYASTDEIVARVHKGRGMSQYGAYDLANQGYNYQQILNRYYPGVAVARVILKN